MRIIVPMFSCAMLLIVVSKSAFSQELTPRAYWPTPQGTKFLVLGSSYSTGDIVTDPSLPLVGVESRILTGVIGYQQTFSVAGRTATAEIQLPYVDGTTEGEYRGQPASRNISGVGDFMASLSVNLMGAPAMTAAEFQEFLQDPKPIIAASLKLVVPTGEYEADRLINVGTNRWATKLKLAYLQPIKEKWVVEMGAGVWFFEDNDEFLGMTREQEPLTAVDVSMVRRIKPGFWASIDANYYFGGRTTVDDVRGADFQRNSRLGFSVGYPIKPRHSIKLGFSSGVVTESGGKYNTSILTYVYRLNE